jgi:hypothetical protein
LWDTGIPNVGGLVLRLLEREAEHGGWRLSPRTLRGACRTKMEQPCARQDGQRGSQEGDARTNGERQQSVAAREVAHEIVAGVGPVLDGMGDVLLASL